MLFQELSKLKRSSIMMSIILMAVGIVMIICPAPYIDSVVSVLGYGILILAAIMILDFIAGRKGLMNYIYLTGGLILMLLGFAVLVFDDIVLYLGIVFGLALISDGVISMINAWLYVRPTGRKNWWILAVLAGLLILFGLIILVNPWWNDPSLLFNVIGGMLLFSSVVGIVRLIFLWPIKGE